MTKAGAGTSIGWFGPTLRLVVGTSALVMIAALVFAPNFWPFLTRLDHWTADWRTAYLTPRPQTQNPHLAIVAITDETLRNYVSSPIDRDLLARMVEAIDKAGAKAIGLDILFLKQTEAEKDERLIQAIRSAKAKMVLAALDERGALLPFQREFQTAFLTKAGQPVGYLNERHENDDVVRYTASPMRGSAYPKSFARLLAEAAGVTDPADAGKPIVWLLPPLDGKSAILTIAGERLFDPPAAAEVAQLKGRVVLIGGEFPFRDRHRVPISVRTGESMPGVAIHATVAAQLIDPRFNLSEISLFSTQLLLAALALCGLVMGLALWRNLSVAFIGHGFAVAVLLAVDAFCFAQLRLLLPFTLAVTAWVAGLTAGRLLGAFGLSARIFGSKSL